MIKISKKKLNVLLSRVMNNKCPDFYSLNYTTKKCSGTFSECYECFLNALKPDEKPIKVSKEKSPLDMSVKEIKEEAMMVLNEYFNKIIKYLEKETL